MYRSKIPEREREEGGERVVLPQGVIRFVMIMKWLIGTLSLDDGANKIQYRLKAFGEN